MAKKNSPDLLFGTTPSISGFNTLAEQSVLNPTIITRELIQNSLDAARERGAKPAIIRFEIIKQKPKDIPAFTTYKKNFELAKKGAKKRSGGALPDTEKRTINAIEGQIKAAAIETLCITDNGIGLDDKRMVALLGEGVSNKSAEGAGSYGYGHTTVIPASDLRYILYGGLCKDKKIAAGHAVLASFEQDKEIKDNNGYFVIDKTGKIDAPFKFPEGKAVPKIIAEKLEVIDEEWDGSGSVIMVPGFNRFREGEDTWDKIREAAACNFFVAIAEGELEIEYKEGSKPHKLNKKNLGKTLEEYREKKRAKFLSGNKAYQAYKTILEGKCETVTTALGNIKIRWRELSEGKTQIDLCRNGMHISNNIPNFRPAEFTSYAPFHCLIMTDIDDGEFHRLIRKAEPPKHDAIEIKSLDKEEKKAVNEALKEIREALKSKLTKLETEEFTIKDVLNLNKIGVDALEALPPRTRVGGGSRGERGEPNGDGDSKSGGGSDGDFRKSGTAVDFSAVPVQTGSRSYEVQLIIDESRYDNEIRFSLDESIDETCDGTAAEDFVALLNIKIDGENVETGKLVKDAEGRVLGINLGKSDTQKEMNLTFDFALPDNASIAENARVSLQAELVRRKVEKEA